MRAKLLFLYRLDYDDGAIVEMKIWRVPQPVEGSSHHLKYSLYYGREGSREIGYDNERGKGDHRHFGDLQTGYEFVSAEKLMDDFWADVQRRRGGQ